MLSRLFTRIAAAIAARVLRREWCNLQRQLAALYALHVADASGSPPLLAQQLLISGEDHRFFSHTGVDLIAVLRSVWRGTVLGRVEGASTIEMQVVRVVSGRYERTLRRKLREVGLAALIGQVVPKRALPSIYLRIGYFGWRTTGFAAACTRIRRTPRSLSSFETAALVARLKYPQARTLSRWKEERINRRARHLLFLCCRHQQTATYVGLTRVEYAAT
jgi:membrane carboxypeptidase/penicillin-binding protein PbpC